MLKLRSPFVSLAVFLFLVGLSLAAAVRRDIGKTLERGEKIAAGLQTISITYDIAKASGGIFNGSGLITGFYRHASARSPLFVWFPGTHMNGTSPIDQWIVNQMAQRGYVSVAVEYAKFPVYDRFEEKAAAAAGSSPYSALSIMCADKRVNCDAGIAVAGYSQGTHITLLSGKYNHKVSAMWLMEGARPTFGNFTICDDPSVSRYLPKRKRRYNTGEGDEYFAWIAGTCRIAGSANCTPTKEKAIHNLRLASGYDCGDENPNCLQPDGSGYYVPTRAVTGGIDPDHFTWVNWNVHNYTTDPVALWFDNTPVWGMNANLDWLATAARK